MYLLYTNRQIVNYGINNKFLKKYMWNNFSNKFSINLFKSMYDSCTFFNITMNKKTEQDYIILIFNLQNNLWCNLPIKLSTRTINDLCLDNDLISQ